ncbi:hypothetical protein [Methanosarcina horonobensis]|uniref:hypothetical protein n=1 Tax=Methanosarcina horonobensis TaxID=418008 RepID=UPI000A81DB06|nr:hypothetical protein [Methanosarcina horonobensis]
MLGIAHDEAISSRLALIWARLVELFMKQSVVEFSALTQLSEDRITDYLSLLFLASSRKSGFSRVSFSENCIFIPEKNPGFPRKATRLFSIK